MTLKKGTVTIEYVDTSNATPQDFVLVDLEDGATVYLVTDRAPFADQIDRRYRSDTHLYVDPDATSPGVISEIADCYEQDISVQGRSHKRAFRKWREDKPDWASKLPLYIKNTHEPDSDTHAITAGKRLLILIGEPAGNSSIPVWLRSPVESVTFHSIATTEQ